MVHCSPLRNSKRCLKASTVNYKIEAFKLVGLVFFTGRQNQNNVKRCLKTTTPT
ncbi:conserved hypothetical protein [Treponema phagedenis]|uniref:Uncharacterized protein n=1 Tax=Treponema phagedenis TaxID=162 RepID=A0A0B7GPI1_TREPH|nr:hypothetical protein HMPREF9554_02425 [Treponema phagedenis F0421]CEM60353.1 conserved hypothetical protein [Treponema phagedenis]